jgi:hypothetical protein
MESRDSSASVAAAAAAFDPSSHVGHLAASFDSFNDFNNTVVFTDTLALDEDPLFPADWDQETPPYDGNLYSTPLSWEPPAEPKIEPPPTAAYTTMNTLTPAQQEKLRNIAMPQHLQYRSQHSPNSTESTKSISIASPGEQNERSRKRKSSQDGEDDDDDDNNPPVKKTAHNMIEKRYRTNLNDKIAALRDSVPSLRIMTKSARGEDTADDREELQGLTPAHKLNKATVLSKATEYINHLEKRNKRLTEENAEQKARLAAFETLFRSGSMGFQPGPSPIANPFQYSQDYNTPGPSPGMDPQGMIQVPEDMRRLHGQMAPQQQQQTYPVPQQDQYQRQQMGPNGWQNNGYFGKLMVGSLAGLMIMQGFSEEEQKEDSPDARGLSALPVQLIRTAHRAFHSSMNINIAGYHVSSTTVSAYLSYFLVLGLFIHFYAPSLFSAKPKPKDGKTQSPSVAAAPSLASPIQVRRQAWLTAVQSVWVPRHNFFLEAFALCVKIAKLSMRNVIGPHGYAYITGISQEQEAARVKAWEIALDAQLAGGDVEVSKSRLTLTLLASGTLPDTPARLMLKALHIRVLLWEVGNAGFNGFFMFQEVAAKLARWKWNEARDLQRLMASTNQDGALPAYLAALLEQECDDVLVDSIGQRAYNLTWNLPTAENTRGANDIMDCVVEDPAIGTPLDAVAAWFSSLALQRALAKSLVAKDTDAEAQKAISDDLALAIKTSPIGSSAQIRALVARAVIVKEKRGASIAASLQALGPLQMTGEKTAANLINTSASMDSIPDVRMSIRAAMAIAHIERFPSPSNPEAAHRIIASIRLNKMTLLGFTAVFKLMESINDHKDVALSCASSLEAFAGVLRIWIGGKEGEASGLDRDEKHILVERCLGITKRILGVEDAGYASMSEEEVGEGC